MPHFPWKLTFLVGGEYRFRRMVRDRLFYVVGSELCDGALACVEPGVGGWCRVSHDRFGLNNPTPHACHSPYCRDAGGARPDRDGSGRHPTGGAHACVVEGFSRQ